VNSPDPFISYAPHAEDVVLRDEAAHLLEPRMRADRRREIFRALLKDETPGLEANPQPDLRPLALSNLSHFDAISLLYRAILGRRADSQGLQAWVSRLSQGEALLTVAQELAESPEAISRPASDRARVRRDLVAWESMSALSELGVAVGEQDHLYPAGHVRDVIFVESLFEVALERHPTKDELRIELEKLISGGGQEWLLRTYANRPEVRARFLGEPAPGIRNKLRGWRKGRGYLDIFRHLVVAAEARQVSHLLARLAAIDAESPSPDHHTPGVPEGS
jgi:hypothetical protein